MSSVVAPGSARPLIATGKLARSRLAGEVVIVTGGGKGIGFECARALAWLGADVVIAEIDAKAGDKAARRITAESAAWEAGPGSATFVPTDVGDETSVAALAREVLGRFGRADAVVNNATVAPLGAVRDVPIEAWDRSYGVNLRGPVLLARAFLPGMIERDHGVFVAVLSMGTAYMGAYETLKTAQGHLATTLDAELEGTGVVCFSIGPGLVPTATAAEGVAKLGGLMGLTLDEFLRMNEAVIISVETAGAGFAAAVALASEFRGQDSVSSLQALSLAGIAIADEDVAAQWPGATKRSASTEGKRVSEPGPAEAPPSSPPASAAAPAPASPADALSLCRHVLRTLEEQSAGWAERSLFERQWVTRDFQKKAGMPVAKWLTALRTLEGNLAAAEAATTTGRGPSAAPAAPPVAQLAAYYDHLAKLADGFGKDPVKRAEHAAIVRGWRDDAARLAGLLGA